jgi:hypothetical protein
MTCSLSGTGANVRAAVRLEVVRSVLAAAESTGCGAAASCMALSAILQHVHARICYAGHAVQLHHILSPALLAALLAPRMLRTAVGPVSSPPDPLTFTGSA